MRMPTFEAVAIALSVLFTPACADKMSTITQATAPETATAEIDKQQLLYTTCLNDIIKNPDSITDPACKKVEEAINNAPATLETVQNLQDAAGSITNVFQQAEEPTSSQTTSP